MDLTQREQRGIRPRALTGRRRWVRVVMSLLAFALVLGVTAQPGAPAQAATTLKVGGLSDAVWAYAFSPDRVPGANDWTCRPTAAHPRPVVLVHATATNMGFNWAALSPMLKNQGYCVFALNYGSNLTSMLTLNRTNGLGDIAASAGELRSFVDRVLSSTRATRVDIVGHSQGGMMPHHYIERLGGATKVGTFIGLAPSNHGTTLSGLTSIGTQLGILGVSNVLLNAAMPSLVQQEIGSPFQTALFNNGDTVAGPSYVVIETTKDEIVTPYTNAFLTGPAVTNILIQNQCPADTVGHIGIAFDSPALQDVMNYLGPKTPNFKPTCTGYGVGV